MILLIDNYDSFTYNLVQCIGGLSSDPDALDLRVIRNDKISVEEVEACSPDQIIISPGPCTPSQAGISCDLVKAFAGRVPIFGVCLGHQSIAQSFGMKIIVNYRLMHGKTSPIHHDGQTIFKAIPNPFTATRYHSLVIDKTSFDNTRFEISAWTEEGEIMALRAKPNVFGPAPLEGVQFHPESFLTQAGDDLIANFLALKKTITP